MSGAVVISEGDAALTGEILEHLEAQMRSAQRLLQIVLEQGVAIREREVHAVVQLTGVLQAELHRRERLDSQRADLLERAGARLGIAPSAVTLTLMTRLMDPRVAEFASARSAQLRGLLAEVQREHYVNRALMAQELAFLDHLLKLAEQDRTTCYDAAGESGGANPTLAVDQRRVLDLEV
jgi:flagellar biosynthesis/type III secretory pathway chaperone